LIEKRIDLFVYLWKFKLSGAPNEDNQNLSTGIYLALDYQYQEEVIGVPNYLLLRRIPLFFVNFISPPDLKVNIADSLIAAKTKYINF